MTTKAQEKRDDKQRQEDYDKVRRYLVANSSGIAVRLLVKPVYSGDLAYANNVLEVRKEPVLISPWLDAHEIADAHNLLKRYGVLHENYSE